VWLIYLPAAAWPASPVFRSVLTPVVLNGLASVLKLVALGSGAWLAGRSAARLPRDNPARPAWRMLSVFLGAFFAGQCVLSAYEAAHHTPPLPSAGDAFFLLGYVVMIGALTRFVRVYRASGFPLGGRGEHAAIALGAAAMFLAVGLPFLAPIARAPHPLGERLINLAYPVLDLVALVPTILLVRITWPLRGGLVWGVWTTLVAGLLCATGGDVVFAWATSAGATWLDPLIDPLLITSYALLAFGAALQDALVRGQ
jgi:hypothetical protein